MKVPPGQKTCAGLPAVREAEQRAQNKMEGQSKARRQMVWCLLGHAKGLFLTMRTIKQQERLGMVAQT